MTFYVYMITRNDGLSYIGITKDLATRLTVHTKSPRFNGLGIKETVILYESENYSDVEVMEEMKINEYDTWHNGLNITETGKGLNKHCKFNTLGYVYSEKSRQKMRDNHWSKTGSYSPIGRRHSDETRRKFSSTRKGKVGNSKLMESQIKEIFSLFLSHQILEGVGTKMKNGKILTQDYAFARHYCSQFGMSGVGLLNILRGKTVRWKALLLEMTPT
jgi:predicted GIY-YIG superfamily endonuclease